MERVELSLIPTEFLEDYLRRYRQVVDGQQMLLWCDACEAYLPWDQLNVVSLLQCIELHDKEHDKVLFPPGS